MALGESLSTDFLGGSSGTTWYQSCVLELEDYYAIPLCSLGIVREAEDEFDMMPKISSGRHLDPGKKILLDAMYVHAIC